MGGKGGRRQRVPAFGFPERRKTELGTLLAEGEAAVPTGLTPPLAQIQSSECTPSLIPVVLLSVEAGVGWGHIKTCYFPLRSAPSSLHSFIHLSIHKNDSKAKKCQRVEGM